MILPLRRTLVFFIALSFLPASSAGQQSGAARAQGFRATERPVIYAHYMHCYILGTMTDGDLQQRQAPPDVAQDPDAWPLSETIERSWWSARLAPLAQSGKAGVAADFALAETAGLDALALLISTRHLPSSAYAAGMDLAAQVASDSKVKLIPDLWDLNLNERVPPREELVKYGQGVKALMDRYPNAFFAHRGRPVISLGNAVRSERPFRWADYRAVFEPWGGAQAVYIILNLSWRADELPDDWGHAVDAFSRWAATQGWNDPQTHVLLQMSMRYRKPLAWPVSSSYYGGRQGTENIAESLGISRFTDQWRQAIASRTSFVVIQSWNDFSEDHAITETNYRGTSLIEINRYFADWYHGGIPPKIVQDAIYLFHHRQLVGAQLTDATIYAVNDNWHATPTTDYLDVLTMLTQPGKIRLRSGRHEWTLDAPAGVHEWLVYVPSGRFTLRSIERHIFRSGGSYPVSSAERAVTPVEEISAGFAEATLLRDDQPIASVRSRVPIAARGRWQDLSLIGSVGRSMRK